MPKRILLIGRPNVGKSSLFNALLGYRRSIVLDLPGTTVDFIWENFEWEKVVDGALQKREVLLGDAMGLHTSKDIQGAFKEIQNVDAILWVVDLESGLTPLDREIADELRRFNLPVLIVANKSDAATEHGASFLKWGFKEWIETSAVHRRGLEEIRNWLEPYSSQVPEKEKVIKLAILGKPNSGKSTLTNLLSGKQVSRVSPIALTTRDPIFIETENDGQKFLIMDTAGLRRPRSEMSQVEKFSVHASTRTIREADVVLLMIASHESITDQDMRLLNLLQREGKPTLVLLNFWDRLDRKERSVFLKDSEFAPYLKEFRVLPISAKESFDTDRILPLVALLRKSSERRIKTSKLNDIVGQMIEKNPPPAMAGHPVNILFTSQVRVNPPTFVFFTSRPHLISDTYKRYLEKGIRERFGYKSQPVKLIFKNKNPKTTSAEK